MMVTVHYQGRRRGGEEGLQSPTIFTLKFFCLKTSKIFQLPNYLELNGPNLGSRSTALMGQLRQGKQFFTFHLYRGITCDVRRLELPGSAGHNTRTVNIYSTRARHNRR